METYTLDQIKDLLQSQGYKHICLRTMEGKDLVKYNPNTIKVDKRFKEIITRLESPALVDGYYVVGCKFVIAKDAESDDYLIAKGNPENLPAPAPLPAPVGENVLTYTSALKMQNSIAQLTAKNETLTRECADYKEKYDTLMGEVEEIMGEEPEEEGLSEPSAVDNIGTMLSELMKVASPIADKHFELRDRELTIQEGHIYNKILEQQNGTGQPVPNQSQPQNSIIEFEELTEDQLDQLSEEEFNRYKMAQLTHLSQTNPEEYNRVVAEMENNG